jgi:hypothetical protein
MLRRYSHHMDRSAIVSRTVRRFGRLGLCGAALFMVFPASAAAQSASAPAPWYERIQFGGDFRSRYEGFYQDGRETRHRSRFRLRLRIDSDVNDDTHLQIQIASGDPGTPVSTNQTFTSFFRPKPFNLDRANIRYNPSGASALTLGMGKFGSPMTRTQLLWDDDLNFEGGYEQVAWNVSDTVDVQLLALQTAVNEVSRDADSFMVAGYGEVGVSFGAHRVQVSLADYGFGNVDQVAVGRATGPLNSLLTNLVDRDAAGNIVGLVSDFNMVDTIVEAEFDTGRDDYPFRVLGEYLKNTKAASDRDTGLWFEAEYGGSRTPRTYTLGYTYGRIQQEAVLSAFMFSDIPGSNTEMHMFNIAYIPLPNLSLDLNMHVTRGLDVDPGATNNWLMRPHIAAIVRF